MPYFTKRPGNDREIKNLQIYSILRNKKEVSRADLTAITGINPVSISNYTNIFIKNGLIIEKEIGLSSGGRPPIMLQLNNAGAFSIGIHVKFNQTQCVVMSSNMSIQKKFSIEGTDDQISKNIKAIVDTVLESISKDQIKNVFVVIENSDNAQESLAQIEKEISFPVYLCDASAAGAYNEKLREKIVDDNESFIFSYNDTGMCTFVKGERFFSEEDASDNEVYRYLSAWNKDLSIVSCANRVIRNNVDSKLRSLEKLNEMSVYEAAKDGDPLAVEILEFVGLTLSVRLSYLINMLKPNKIIIDGVLSNGQNVFLEGIKKGIKTLACNNNIDMADINYGENDPFSIAIGTAGLGIRETFIGG
ncbi:MAG: ROK family protein [Candidatus Omnitrophica bacterium]|nr:ROK family protein [Candidatus Omnitrophota bacterium]